MKNILTLLLFLPLLVLGQFSDDFTDGDITLNPAWQGDTDKFIVNDDDQLQLWDDAENQSFLAVPQQRSDSTEWLFLSELHFSPSANNNARIYLLADEGNPSLVNQGVYLQLGESGSDDALSLFYKSGEDEVEICRGTEGMISSSFELNIKVTYRSPGIWRIYYDPLNNGNYVLDAEGSQEISFEPSFFIIQCTYTISNSTDFIFDNFIVRPFQLDIQSPEIEEVTTVSDREIEIHFSEPVDPGTATDPVNYLLDSQHHPTQVVFDEMMNDQVNIVFETPFQNNSTHILSVSCVTDIQGNIMDLYEASFTYLEPFSPEAGEVVINELMVDVNPEPAELPPYDYLELHNTTDKLLDMTQSTITWGTHHLEMPEESLIPPGGYLVLADDNASYEEDVDLEYFSSIPLNTETLLVLKNAEQQVLHALDYKKEWYHNPEKADGGWSLEMIDPLNRGGGINNYKASENEGGGTPGYENSVFGANPDTTAPFISSIAFASETTVRIIFSEPMDSLTIMDFQSYVLQPPGVSPENVIAEAPFYNRADLYFPESVYQENTLFELETNGIYDYSGNLLFPEKERFSTYQAEPGDVIITEVMADVNPVPRGLAAVEYVELFNRSAFPVDISGWRLFINDAEELFPEGTSIDAGAYKVIAEAQPQNAGDADLLDVQGLAIPNKGCEIYLVDNTEQLIHYINYQNEWINDPLKQEGGWSAEMIDFQNYCGERDNWRASNDPAGGTPGVVNSVNGKNTDKTPPDVLRVTALSDNGIRLYFNELMNTGSLLQKDIYSTSPALSILEARPVFPAHNAVDLTFNEDMNPEITYQLEIDRTPCDCAGNHLLLSENASFTYPLIADTSDIIINEIMFNASDDNEDFLEIYNRSDHAIDLSSLFVLLKDPYTGALEKKLAITDEKIILTKEGYLALTRSAYNLKTYYPQASERNILSVDGFPDFPAKEGRVVLQILSGQGIDSIFYDEDLHFGLLNDYHDVSLERVSPLAAPDAKNSWHSAAETHGFATPGAVNSQFLSSAEDNSVVELTPNIITPDNDGKDDILMISIRTEQPGYTMNTTVFDAKGREIVRLANNKYLGTENTIYWDGTKNDHQVVSSGYYIIYLELFNLEGDTQHFKETVVVTSEKD